MTANIEFVTAADLEQQGPTGEAAATVSGLIYNGALTAVVGKPKIGKTLLLLHMCLCVLDGTHFLGRATTKRNVVYLTEQGEASFRAQLKAVGLLGRADFHILFKGKVWGAKWLQIARAAAKKARSVDGLLVVDTLAIFAGLHGDEENLTGPMLEALEPLQIAASVGEVPVVVLHHERKSGGDVSDSGRGSSAFTGAMDTIITVRHPEGNPKPTMRRIEGLSRFGEVPDEIVELTEHGYAGRGDAGDIERASAKTRLLALIPDAPKEVMRTELFRQLQGEGFKHTTLGDALKQLVAEGKVGQETKAGKGQPLALSKPVIHLAALKKRVPVKSKKRAGKNNGSTTK